MKARAIGAGSPPCRPEATDTEREIESCVAVKRDRRSGGSDRRRKLEKNVDSLV
ncbi:hypothetical protein TIFTF001_017265 [Ficus carica]|uniref:Uncharacterized protein n=1 Tax=Ficus carica TaxID=3494 RepID=A0AA88AA95_FICCA|nr:hypothetical protein TIFTF001_017265 [Ficus carica]